jgi:hypothetical protein
MVQIVSGTSASAVMRWTTKWCVPSFAEPSPLFHGLSDALVVQVRTEVR